jgi:hypothetical protein
VTCLRCCGLGKTDQATPRCVERSWQAVVVVGLGGGQCFAKLSGPSALDPWSHAMQGCMLGFENTKWSVPLNNRLHALQESLSWRSRMPKHSTRGRSWSFIYCRIVGSPLIFYKSFTNHRPQGPCLKGQFLRTGMSGQWTSSVRLSHVLCIYQAIRSSWADLDKLRLSIFSITDRSSPRLPTGDQAQ